MASRRPFQVNINKKQKTCRIMDFIVLVDNGEETKENEKRDKYLDLMLYTHNTNISRNIIKHNDDFNERTNTLLYENIALTLYSR